jgi:hypothetical protein
MDIVGITKGIFSGIGIALPWIKQILDLFKSGLDTTKTAQGIFQKGNEDIVAATENKEGTNLERAQVAGELLRSFAWFGAIEACFRLGMSAIIVWMFKECVKALRKRPHNS